MRSNHSMANLLLVIATVLLANALAVYYLIW